MALQNDSFLSTISLLGESNDTIFTAEQTGIFDGGSFFISAAIGDNPNLFAEDDVDLYAVNLDAGDQLFADIDADIFGTGLDSVLTVFDSFGFAVAQNDDDFGSLDPFIDFTASFDGTYYIGVSSFANFDYSPFSEGSGSGNSFGDYDLFIDVVAAPDEPNDTVFTAEQTGIFDGGSFFASAAIGDNPNLFAEDDVDLYAVNLDAGDQLFADIDADIFGTGLDSVLTVFDSFGFAVAQNDDDFGSLDSFIDFTASFDDTYYVGVSSFANFDYSPFSEGSGSGNSFGDYDLFIDVVAAPDEPNDTLFTAEQTGIFDGGSFFISAAIGDNPNLFAEDDVDLYAVQLDVGDQLFADIDADVFGTGLDSVLTVFNSSGFAVAQNDDDFDSFDSFIDFTASFSDIYYVGVSSFANFDYNPFSEGSGSGDSFGAYDLFIDVVAA